MCWDLRVIEKKRLCLHLPYNISSLRGQESAVKVLDIPPQLVLHRLALRHDDLLLVLGHSEALPADGVLQEPGVAVPGPPLIASGSVTRIKDDVRARVVETRVVTANLPGLTPQPVLVTALEDNICISAYRDNRIPCSPDYDKATPRQVCAGPWAGRWSRCRCWSRCS